MKTSGKLKKTIRKFRKTSEKLGKNDKKTKIGVLFSRTLIIYQYGNTRQGGEKKNENEISTESNHLFI